MEILEAPAAGREPRRRLCIDLVIFTAVAFVITWLVVGAYIWDEKGATSLMGPMRLGAPAFYLAVSAPTISAVTVTSLRYGRPGLADLFRSLIRIRAGWMWIAVALLGYPLLWLLVALVTTLASGNAIANFNFGPWLVTLPLLLLHGHMFRDIGSLGEELGWRGFALPRLLDLMDARAASLVLGLVWALWHLPAFFLASMSQSSVDFGMFVLNVLAFSAFMTWLFVNTRGSVFWAGVVPHILFNATPRAGIPPVVWIAVAVSAVLLVMAGPHLRKAGRAVLPQFSLWRTDRLAQ